MMRREISRFPAERHHCLPYVKASDKSGRDDIPTIISVYEGKRKSRGEVIIAFSVYITWLKDTDTNTRQTQV